MDCTHPESPNDASVDDPAKESRKARVKILLGRASSFERTPRGFDQWWLSVQNEEEGGSTARIFWDKGGFAAWFVYVVAKNASGIQGHFQGKTDICNLITNLEKESGESREQLALDVGSAIPSDVKQRIDRVYDKRIKQTRDGHMTQTNKRRRSTESRLLPSSPVIEADATVNSATPHYAFNHRPSHQEPVQNILDSLAPDDQVFVSASLAVAVCLLPRDLANDVQRHPHPEDPNTLVAGIGMSIPTLVLNVECQMALEITPDKVQHYALMLFGVHLQTTAGLRYICIAGGAQALPAPQLTLRGCKADMIPDTFGPEVSAAILASRMYQDDVVKNHRDCTHSVSMLISQQADDVAVIILSLGLFRGTRIREKLYAI